MRGEPKNQFPLTRAALSKCGPRKKLPIICWALVSLFSTFAALAVEDTNLTLGTIVVTNNKVRLTLHCDSAFEYFIQSSTNFQGWAQIATTGATSATRVVTFPSQGDASFYRAVRGLLVHAAAGIAAVGNTSFKGNDVYLDAYDSSDGVHFPGGVYNAANAFARGHVASQQGVIDAGNATVHGWLILGPTASFSLGPSGVVGDMPANWPAQSGVQGPEWLVPCEPVDYPDVFAPYSSGSPPPAGTGTNTYDLGTGNYFVGGDFTLNNDETLYVEGTAKLYVTGNLTAKSGSSITLAPWAALTIYVGASSGAAVSASFNVINNPADTYRLALYGLPTCTNVTLNCTPAFRGFIYAPAAALVHGAGGSCGTDVQGACVVNSVLISGRFSLHFDWNLTRQGG